MILDVTHVDYALDDGVLIKLSHVVANIRVRGNKLSIGLEIYNVDLVESNQRHEQADVQSVQALVVENVSLGSQYGLNSVEGVKQLLKSGRVCTLRFRKPALIHACI